MPKSLKNTPKSTNAQSWQDWATSNLNWAAEQAADKINSAFTSMSQAAKEAVMGQVIDNMPPPMSKMLLYGITADNVIENSAKINSYVQAAHNSYAGFISKFTSPLARRAVEAAISYMFLPIFMAGVASYSLDAFVKMDERDKLFIVQRLLPKMSAKYQNEYWQMFCAKKDSGFTKSLMSILKELASANSLHADLNTKILQHQTTIEKKASKSFFPSIPSFLRRSSSDSLDSLESNSPKNKKI